MCDVRLTSCLLSPSIVFNGTSMWMFWTLTDNVRCTSGGLAGFQWRNIKLYSGITAHSKRLNKIWNLCQRLKKRLRHSKTFKQHLVSVGKYNNINKKLKEEENENAVVCQVVLMFVLKAAVSLNCFLVFGLFLMSFSLLLLLKIL